MASLDRPLSPAETRFQAELEFVNALASPDYLLHLAQQRNFESRTFVTYLEHLHETFTAPEYAQYVIYPHALCFLELLQDAEFRSQISQTEFKEAVHAAQFYSWAYERANALKLRADGNR